MLVVSTPEGVAGGVGSCSGDESDGVAAVAAMSTWPMTGGRNKSRAVAFSSQEDSKVVQVAHGRQHGSAGHTEGAAV